MPSGPIAPQMQVLGAAGLAFLVSLVLAAPSSAEPPAASLLPLVAQIGPSGSAGAVSFGLEVAAGTRELQVLGTRGAVQTAQLGLALSPAVQLQTFAGQLVGDTPFAPRAWHAGIGAQWHLARNADRGLALVLVTQLVRDLGGAMTPRLGLTASHRRAGWTVATTVLAETPLNAPRRDPLDVVVALGAVRQLGRWQLGAEIAGNDLEALWSAAEAEHGARVVAGPVAAVALGAWSIRGSAGAAWTAQQQTLGYTARIGVVWAGM